jgi:hypothetical protein
MIYRQIKITFHRKRRSEDENVNNKPHIKNGGIFICFVMSYFSFHISLRDLTILEKKETRRRYPDKNVWFYLGDEKAFSVSHQQTILQFALRNGCSF